MQTSALNAELNAALTDVKAKDRQKVEVLGYVGHDLRCAAGDDQRVRRCCSPGRNSSSARWCRRFSAASNTSST